MSTSAVSTTSIYAELQAFTQSRQTDVKQLGSALQNGDLAGAQQAFNALVTLGQGGPFANAEPFSKNTRAQAFETIGQDLQNGDLAGAQAAFAALTAKGNDSGQQAQSAPGVVVTVSGNGGNAPPAPANADSIYAQLQAYRQTRITDLAQLGQDLQAGNQTAAQTDVANLTALGQTGPHADGQIFERTDRAQDFQAIGQALQSGDLAGAETAYTALASTFGNPITGGKTAIGGPVTGGETAIGGPVTQPPTSTSNVPEIVINLGQGNGTSSANPEEITINLGGNNSGGQVTVSSGQGSNAEQLQINLNQLSNNELILNLFNSNAASQVQSSSTGLSVQA